LNWAEYKIDQNPSEKNAPCIGIFAVPTQIIHFFAFNTKSPRNQKIFLGIFTDPTTLFSDCILVPGTTFGKKYYKN